MNPSFFVRRFICVRAILNDGCFRPAGVRCEIDSTVETTITIYLLRRYFTGNCTVLLRFSRTVMRLFNFNTLVTDAPVRFDGIRRRINGR